jgi:hypothetical protein
VNRISNRQSAVARPLPPHRPRWTVSDFSGERAQKTRCSARAGLLLCSDAVGDTPGVPAPWLRAAAYQKRPPSPNQSDTRVRCGHSVRDFLIRTQVKVVEHSGRCCRPEHTGPERRPSGIDWFKRKRSSNLSAVRPNHRRVSRGRVVPLRLTAPFAARFAKRAQQSRHTEKGLSAKPIRRASGEDAARHHFPFSSACALSKCFCRTRRLSLA